MLHIIKRDIDTWSLSKIEIKVKSYLQYLKIHQYHDK